MFPSRSRASRRGTTFALFVGLGVAATLQAWASGSSGGGSTRPDPAGQSTSEDLKTCPRGEIWDIKRQRCVKASGAIIPDDALADYAYALAKADRYEEALGILDMIRNPDTAKVLNYRGYATRKLGRTEEGIGYYLRAVAIDPNYAQVREYLGEAYVVEGHLDLARQQLDVIKGLCGPDCEPYEDLANAIAHAPSI